MNFGNATIPQELFELARERLRRGPTSTPEDVREHLLQAGAAALQRTTALPGNHRIIADRVFQAVRKELLAAGEIVQLKRGVWATAKFMSDASASPGSP